MRFRIGLILGLGAGYVLGTKAGRERYEQIRRWFHHVAGSPQVQQLAEKGKEVAGEAAHRGAEAVQSAVTKVGSNVRDRLGNGHQPEVDVQQLGT